MNRCCRPEATTLRQYLSLSAHDLKQPLNALQLYLGLLQSKSDLSKDHSLVQVSRDSLRGLQAIVTLLTQWASSDNQSLKQDPVFVSGDAFIKLTEALQNDTIEVSLSPVNDVTITEQKSTIKVDLVLIQHTLQEMTHLLPKPVTVTAGELPWSLTLLTPPLLDQETGEYKDALYQLAVDGGEQICKALGFRLELLPHTSDESQLQLTLLDEID